MKKPLIVLACSIAVVGVLLCSRAQQVTVSQVISTNNVFSSTTLIGASASAWGAQFAAITNLNGTPVFPVATLTNFFGQPGVAHSLVITSINNPQGGTNLYTVMFSAQ